MGTQERIATEKRIVPRFDSTNDHRHSNSMAAIPAGSSCIARPLPEGRAKTIVLDSIVLDSIVLDSIVLDSIALDSIALDSIAIDSITLDSILG
ncbi:hypothetical protein GCM10023156_44820 [Novipirellula rosea]|uniref:Uncharacterized protein n=1 Tax=Novipirellula rosea TaxID=1031540 RepID=A0ABP8N7J5_9BACT